MVCLADDHLKTAMISCSLGFARGLHKQLGEDGLLCTWRRMMINVSSFLA